jgi:hypothetical protein
MAEAVELLDSQALIAEFVADAERSTMVLPQMTTGQRKQTKKILESYPELTCESYGFGQERKLHLFKAAGEPPSTASVPDTCVEHELAGAGSLPTSVPSPRSSTTNTLQCVMDGPVCKLDLSSIKQLARGAPGWGQASCDDGSTVAPSSCPGSPASTFRKVFPGFRLPPGLELEVQNTFIHYKGPPADERAVQSMPRSMFRQALVAEAMSCQPEQMEVAGKLDDMSPPLPSILPVESGSDSCSLTVGTEVVIEGLSKLPAFNGLRGTLQSFDEESGRYNILLLQPVQGHKSAKVKRENFRCVPASQCLNPILEHAEAPLSLTLSALV